MIAGWNRSGRAGVLAGRLARLMVFCAAGCLWLETPLGCRAGDPVSVLFVEDGAPFRPAYVSFVMGLRQAVATNWAGGVELFTENLELPRFDSPAYRQQVEHWLRDKYQRRQVNALIAGGACSSGLAVKLRDEFWPGVPILILGEGATNASPVRAAGLTRVDAVLDADGTLDLAWRLCPSAQRVALIGASARGYALFDHQVEEKTRKFAADHRLEVIRLNGLEPAEYRRQVAALPPDTILLFLGITADPAGRPVDLRAFLRELVQEARAPVFVFSDSTIGYGSIGGSCLCFSALGAETARMLKELLRAGSVAPAPVLGPSVHRVMVDWRQLRRFGLNPAAIPPGAEVLFRPPTLWGQYRRALSIAACVVVFQAALIGGLLVQMRRRRLAEQRLQRMAGELRSRQQELAHVGRVSLMGQLASALAHELSQPLHAILRNAAAGELFLQETPPAVEEMREILAAIKADDQRAAGVIESMRALIKRHKLKLKPVDLTASIREVIALVQPDAVTRQATIRLEADQDLPLVNSDIAHIQQVLLNLLLNALDAFSAAATLERTILVRVAACPPDRLRVEVVDSGPGFSAATQAGLFTPFFTTKANGMGMGLAITRRIIEAHLGQIGAHNNAAGGATFWFELPVWRGGRET